KTSTVKTIETFDGQLDKGVAGQSVTVTLEDEVDCSRGDVIATAGDPPEASDQFQATFVWMDEAALKPGRGYWLKLGSQMVTATVQTPKYEIDVNSLEHLAAKTLQLNSIGVAEFATDRPITFEPYSTSRQLGGFILIDKFTNATVGAGMIDFILRRAQKELGQATTVTRAEHANMKNQTPRVLWFTGL
ncbi:MAG: adenylyl-sulfate kinase, partial [Pseudomonadota bacterium]